MKAKKQFRGILGVFLILAFAWPVQADVFIGEVETGLVEWSDYRYPVFLYVPTGYKESKEYPLIISLPEIGGSIEGVIQSWENFAKQRSFFVLVPSVQFREDKVPFSYDKWFFEIKAEVMNRYRIDEKRTYLVGQGNTAHYAAYMGVQFPEEFSAVALIDGSWIGPFEKIMTFKNRPIKQVPFYVILGQRGSSLYKETEKIGLHLQEKGYPVYLSKQDGEKSFSSKEFRSEMIEWLEEAGSNWNLVVEESRKSFKEKTYSEVEDFFKVS